MAGWDDTANAGVRTRERTNRPRTPGGCAYAIPPGSAARPLRIARDLENDLNRELARGGRQTKWDVFQARFRREHLAGLSDSYRETMNSVLNQLAAFQDIERVTGITCPLLSQFASHLRDRGIADTTIRSYLAHVHSLLTWAADQGVIAAVPKLPRIKMPQKMKGRPITGEEFDRMIEAVPKVKRRNPDAWYRLLRGLWLSGLRLREAMILAWDESAALSIDLSGQYPRVRIKPDGQKRRRDQLLPLTPDFALWLLETPEYERRGRVFPLGRLNPPGSTPRQTQLRQASSAVSSIGRRARVVVSRQTKQRADGPREVVNCATAHDLRRSFGTRWAPRVKPPVLKELMRHSSIRTTERYYVALDADDLAADLWAQFADSNTSGNTAQKTT